MIFLHIFRFVFFVLFVSLSSLSVSAFNSIPTLPPSNLQSFNHEGNRIQLTWTPGDGERRIVIAKKGSVVTSIPTDGSDYNANTTFGNGDELAPDEFIVYDGVNSSTYIYGLDHSSTYHFAIFEYNGSNSSTEYLTGVFGSGNASTLFPPNTQASGLNSTNLTGHSFTLNWTNGDGSGRIVLLKESNPVNAVPSQNTLYNSSTVFGNGAEIGTDNFVVYRGFGNSVTITNLEPCKTYYFAVFEYNGSSGPVYFTPAITGSQLTLSAPTVQASNLTFSNVDGNRARANFTKGNGAYRLVVIRKDNPVSLSPIDGVSYQANGIFGSGDELGLASGEFVIYSNLGTSISFLGLDHSSTYYVKVFEYNGTGANTKYLTSSPLAGSQVTLSPPTIQTSNITFSNVTGNSMTINWDNGNGSHRLIVLKESAPVDADPSHYQNYFAHSNFESGIEIGTGNHVVYGHIGSSVTVNNLSPNKVYHVAAYEYNGVSGKVYLVPGATASQLTVGAPSVPSSNLMYSSLDGNRLRLDWTKGNGTKSIVIAKKSSPVTSIPVDGIEYTTNANFGIGDELAPGEFVVHNTVSSGRTIYSLDHSSTYYFRVFEYNGDGANTFYLTSSFETGFVSTLSAPTIQASNIVFSQLLPISVKLDFTAGDGTKRIVVANQTGPVDVDPVDLEVYGSNPQIGSPNGRIGATNNYVVYSSSGTTTTVENVTAGSECHFAIYEYNGSSGPIYLKPPTRSSVTTPYLPTIQSSNISYSDIGTNRIRLNWTKGNGVKRIVLAKKGSPVDASVVNGVDYVANSFFGLGEEIGTGNFVVYNGTNSVISLTGLDVSSTYHFAILEFAGTGSNITYLTPAFISQQATVSHPLVAPSNIAVNNLTASTATVSWTNGDGNGRLVVLSEGQPLNSLPNDGTHYTSHANFGLGHSIGNGFVLYNGTNSTANVSDLQQGTTYYISVFEYNGPIYSSAFSSAGTFVFTTDGPPIVPTTALSVTTLNTTSIQVSWTNGGGQKRLVLVKEDTPVDVVPINGIEYVENAGFGSGDELGTDNFVVYSGDSDEFSLFNLQPGKTYYLAVFEYNFSDVATRYLTANPATIFTSIALPVQWLSFSAKQEGSDVILNWETTSEEDNHYFEVEYSKNGQAFNKLGKVYGLGNSSSINTYKYKHENVSASSNYYRLKQIDLDGMYAYSNIINVHGKSRLNEELVYPNPAESSIEYKITIAIQEDVAIEVFNSIGQTLKIFTLKANETNLNMDVSQLSEGIYFIKNMHSGVTTSFIKR